MPGLATWPTGSGGGVGWPTASGDVGPDLVQVRHPIRGQDASGGRTVEYPDDWEPDVLAGTVAAVTRIPRVSESNRFDREGTIALYHVTLAVRLQFRDQVLWLETGNILTVKSASAGGTLTARTW